MAYRCSTAARRCKKAALGLTLLLLYPPSLLANTQHFQAPLNAVKWEPSARQEPSAKQEPSARQGSSAGKEPSADKKTSAGKKPSTENLHCSLSHDIPLYGRATFAKSAGHELGFRMTTKWNIGHNAKRARLRAMPPEWRPQAVGQDLGEIPVQPGNALFQVGESLTQRLLMALQNGMEVSFSYPAGPDEQDHIRVSLPGVNFRQAMDEFATCLSRLRVYDFADFSNTVVHFAAGSDGLSAETRQRLDAIASYLRTDPTVKKIIIAGHTDDIGQYRDNDKLGQRRSAGIRDYLQAVGVPADKFELRSLGERKPIYTNTTNEGRARNRRAHITLVREGGEQASSQH